MSEQAVEQTPFWLAGNFAPTFEEVTATDLKVTGSIPPELNGRLPAQRRQPANGGKCALVSRQWHDSRR